MARIKDLMGLLLFLDDRKQQAVQRVFTGKRKVSRHREAVLRSLQKQGAGEKDRSTWDKFDPAI